MASLNELKKDDFIIYKGISYRVLTVAITSVTVERYKSYGKTVTTANPTEHKLMELDPDGKYARQYKLLFDFVESYFMLLLRAIADERPLHDVIAEVKKDVYDMWNVIIPDFVLDKRMEDPEVCSRILYFIEGHIEDIVNLEVK